MNRREFLRGATTAAVVAAVPIAAVGQQERYLLKNLGPPKSARSYVDELEEAWGEDWRNIHTPHIPFADVAEVAQRWRERLRKSQDEAAQLTWLLMTRTGAP